MKLLGKGLGLIIVCSLSALLHMNISPKGKYLSLLVVILLISLKSYGQSEDKLGSWFIYIGIFNVNPKLELFLETQLRNYEVFGNPEVFFLRPYFNYNITK